MWAISLERPTTEIVNSKRMGLDGFFSNSLILTREQVFKGRERDSLLVHAYYHTLARSPFSLLSFTHFLKFFLKFLFFFISCVFLPLFSVLLHSPFVLPFLCIVKAIFYTAYRDRFLLFYPLTAFVLVQVSFLDHPLVCRLPSHHHLPVLAMPHPIPRKKSFILFSCSS